MGTPFTETRAQPGRTPARSAGDPLATSLTRPLGGGVGRGAAVAQPLERQRSIELGVVGSVHRSEGPGAKPLAEAIGHPGPALVAINTDAELV